MPSEFLQHAIVMDGVAVKDFSQIAGSADWWVLRVKDAQPATGLWHVYGGFAGTVSHYLKQHAHVAEAVAYPFDDGTASVHARVEIERAYA